MSGNAVTQRVRVPRTASYHALLDPQAIEASRVPEGMRCVVHEFDPHEGGHFRVSLSYDDPAVASKSGRHTDTCHGRFLRLIPDEQVTEVLEFETEDPQGAMTVTTTLTDTDDGSDVRFAYQNLPPGVPAADNRLETPTALSNLAALVETQR